MTRGPGRLRGTWVWRGRRRRADQPYTLVPRSPAPPRKPQNVRVEVELYARVCLVADRHGSTLQAVLDHAVRRALDAAGWR